MYKRSIIGYNNTLNLQSVKEILLFDWFCLFNFIVHLKRVNSLRYLKFKNIYLKLKLNFTVKCVLKELFNIITLFFLFNKSFSKSFSNKLKLNKRFS